MNIPPPPNSVVSRNKIIAFSLCMLALGAATLVIWPEALRDIGSSSFLPHATCYLRDSRLIWLHVTSDMLIGLAYVAISLMLAVLVHRARRDIPFSWVFLAFGLFIVSCGATHFMEVATIWYPFYWLSGDVKLVTAVASVATAVVMPPLIPRAVAMVQDAKASAERKRRLETAHHELEQLHRRSESRFQQLRNSNVIGIVESDLNGRIFDANDAFLTMLGSSHEELAAGKLNWRDLSPPEWKSADDDAVEQVRTVGSCRPFEKEYFHRDGRRVPILLGAARVGDSDDEVVAFAIDQTDQKRAAAALRNTEKLATIGRLAGSIAHEINNPLDAVNNLMYLLRGDGMLPPQAREYVRLATEELQRVTQITRQMLGFYRESSRPVVVDVAQVFDSVLALFARRIEIQDTKIVRDFSADTTIRAFPGEMRQIISNLLVNALEATGRDGTIRLHVYRSHDWRRAYRSGLRISVIDNGPGIAPQDLPHIFEPFFTTKGEKGTGLGLWVTQGIVTKHDGSIAVRSCSAGRTGTCFSVFIPEMAEPAEAS